MSVVSWVERAAVLLLVRIAGLKWSFSVADVDGSPKKLFWLKNDNKLQHGDNMSTENIDFFVVSDVVI